MKKTAVLNGRGFADGIIEPEGAGLCNDKLTYL
jgi:hypothetical protein